MWLIALKSLAGTSRLAVSPDRFVRKKCSDTPSPCVSPDPQGSCAVPFVSADRAAVAAQQRCRDGQEPALVRRISASGCQAPPQHSNWTDHYIPITGGSGSVGSFMLRPTTFNFLASHSSA